MVAKETPARATAEERALLDAIEAKTRASLPQAAIVQRLAVAATVAGSLLLLIGCAAMLGWLVDVPTLYSLGPDRASMKLSTATAMSALGIAVLLTGSSHRHAHRAALSLAVAIVLFAVVMALSYLFDMTSFLDNPFGLDPGTPGSDPAGRMSLATATGLALICTALVLAECGRVVLGQVLATLTLTLAAATLVGYAFGAESLSAIGPFRSIAARTALALLLGALGVLLRRSGEGYVALLSGNTAGGILVRRFLPIAVIVPIAAAWVVVRLQPETAAARTTAGTIALAATAVSLVSAVLVWIQAARLREVDLRRAGAEDAFDVARHALEAQRGAEHRTRAIINASSSAYLEFDVRGRVTDSNSAATALFDLTHKELLGRTIDELVERTNPYGDERSDLRTYFAGEGPLPPDQKYEVTVITVDGRRLNVDITLWTVVDGDHVTFHTLLDDVTERRDAEDALRRANDDLADFTAAMAHDLRTPLTIIKGFAGILAMTIDNPTQRDHLARIENAADRGSSLIDDILTFAQVGHEQIAHDPTSLSDEAKAAAEEQLAASTRNGRVDVRDMVEIVGDPRLLRQLLSNLIGNALKYVPDDRDPEVVVDVVRDEATTWPILRVTDNGDPIEHTDGIFAMFERGAQDDRVIGSGVGLAVCRRIAELHGGRIWLETSETGGPRFCVLLPGRSSARV